MRWLLCIALTGCSMLRTKSVESVGAEKCTTSVAPAGFDTAVAISAIAFAAYSKIDGEDIEHIAIPVATSVLVVFGLSAGVGYYRASKCKQARIREGIAY